MDSALIILIPVSVLIVLGIVGILWWAARSGQFDDMEGPAHAILMDDDKPKSDSAAKVRQHDALPTAPDSVASPHDKP